MNKGIISITHSAAVYIKTLLDKDQLNPIGIRINVEKGGCSGNKYKFEYVYKKEEYDEEITDKSIKIFVNSNIILKIFGTTLDYIDGKVQAGLIFINPNEKEKCGCGASVLF